MLEEILRLTKHKIIIFGAAISVVTLIITLLVFFGSGSVSAGREQPVTFPKEQPSTKLSVYDFLLEEQPVVSLEPEYYLLRKPLPKWEPEQVEKYWIMPQDIIIETIKQKNSRNLEDVLKQIP